MATTKVSSLTAKTTPTGLEEVLINDGGTSKKITIANLTKGHDLPTVPSGITTDTNKEYNLKLTDVSGTETLTWIEETDNDTTYSNFVGDDGVGGVTTAAGLVPAPTEGDAAAGKYLDSDGNWTVPPDTDTDTTYSNFAGTTAGLVPTSTTGDDTKFLRADGTWVVPTDTDTGITDVVDDTTPQLGGNLDLNGNNITGTGAIPAANITGTISGVNFKDVGLTTNAIGSIGGGTQDIDLTLGNSVSGTVDTSTTTFTFSNPTASDELCIFSIVLTNGGSQTVNFPASVDWEGGTAPTLTAAGVDILIFATVDGGTIWHGQSYSLDSKTPS